MVLQKVAEEGQLEVTDTLIDDNNTAIRVSPSTGPRSVYRSSSIRVGILHTGLWTAHMYLQYIPQTHR